MRSYVPGHPTALVLGLILFCRDRDTEYTYINLSFAPAPDDTVLNLYRVRQYPYVLSERHASWSVFRKRRHAYR